MKKKTKAKLDFLEECYPESLTADGLDDAIIGHCASSGVVIFTPSSDVSYEGGSLTSKNVPLVCRGKCSPGTIEPITPSGLNILFSIIGF